MSGKGEEFWIKALSSAPPGGHLYPLTETDRRTVDEYISAALEPLLSTGSLSLYMVDRGLKDTIVNCYPLALIYAGLDLSHGDQRVFQIRALKCIQPSTDL